MAAALLSRGGPVLASMIFAFGTAPGDYAAIALLIALTPIAALVSAVGIDQALFRRWAADPNDPPFRAELFFALCVSMGILPFAAGAGYLTGLLLSMNTLPFVIAGAAGSVQAGTMFVISAHLRATQRSKYYLGFAGFISLSALLLRVSFLAAGIEPGMAWIWGDVANAAMGLLVVGIWLVRGRFGTGTVSMRELVSYGYPLTFHGIWQWVLGSSDRFIFAATLSSAQVGVYGAVYQVAGAYNAAASEVNKSGLHRYAATGRLAAKHAMIKDARILLIVWLAAAVPVGLCLFLLDSTGYKDALLLGTFVYFSMVPLIVYLPIANDVSISQGRSHVLGVSSFVGCVVNVTLVLVLVPAIGLFSGPVANAAGLVAMAAMLVFRRPGAVKQAAIA